MSNIVYKINNSSNIEINDHLLECSDSFTPSLSTYVDINSYSTKIFNKSVRFEAFHEDKLVGLIAMYTNNDDKSAFITNVSVYPKFIGTGIGYTLLKNCKLYINRKQLKKLSLEVMKNNNLAIKFYEKNNFIITKTNKEDYTMELKIERNYNDEFKNTKDHKYAYNFDFDVMHGLMIKSFEPFFKPGNCLELGSFKGDFTKRLLPFFDDITCVEASDEAVEVSKSRFGDDVTHIHSLFETVVLPKKYDNIILTHVLEHIDDPVALLRRINDEWLSDNGRLFLVCPNANAPSRQIAVKMGLITHNSVITSSEKEHGHRITYTLDTLERDARDGGLTIEYRTGIFFKALANFQWDKLLETDIISEEYLDGCYQLGHHYPDLCSSIMLVGKKN